MNRDLSDLQKDGEEDDGEAVPDLRRCLELATMENAERQVKHAVAGKKKSDNKVVEL